MAQPKISEEEKLLQLLTRLRNLSPGTPPFEKVGITPPQFILLDWIANSPGSGVSEIAEGLNLTSPTVSVAVRRLEKEGYLERKHDTQDRRSIHLYLTQEGQALYQRGEEFRQHKVKRLLSGLPIKERTEFLELLETALNAAEISEKEIQRDKIFK